SSRARCQKQGVPSIFLRSDAARAGKQSAELRPCLRTGPTLGLLEVPGVPPPTCGAAPKDRRSKARPGAPTKKRTRAPVAMRAPVDSPATHGFVRPAPPKHVGPKLGSTNEQMLAPNTCRRRWPRSLHGPMSAPDRAVLQLILAPLPSSAPTR